MSARRIKRKNPRGRLLWDEKAPSQEFLLQYRIESNVEADLAAVALSFFKFSYLENGRTLARHHDGRYEFLLSFLSEEQRARAKKNIDKNVIAAKAPAREVPATLTGWQPWGRVLPEMVLQSVSLQGAGDAELTESQALGLLARQEIDSEGDYVIPNLTPEEADYWRQVRDRKKQ